MVAHLPRTSDMGAKWVSKRHPNEFSTNVCKTLVVFVGCPEQNHCFCAPGGTQMEPWSSVLDVVKEGEVSVQAK